MKKNQKIFLSFFFLLFFHETYQFNLKTSIAKYTLNHSIITEALIEKNSKKFIIKIIGKEKWDEMTKSLDSLGSKWKNKILSVLDKIPMETDDKVYSSFKEMNIEESINKINKLKAEVETKIKTFTQINENSESDALPEDKKNLFSFVLDEMESQLNLNISGFDKTKNFSSFNFNEIPSIKKNDFDFSVFRFTNAKFLDSLNPMSAVADLIGQDEMFDQEKAKGTEDLPEPNSKDGGALCTGTGDCKLLQLKVMKCTMIRVVLRTIYELLCGFINLFDTIVMGLCACSPQGPKTSSTSCKNRSSWPGIICNVPYYALIALYSILFILWKGIMVMTQLCKVPLGDLIIGSPP